MKLTKAEELVVIFKTVQLVQAMKILHMLPDNTTNVALRLTARMATFSEAEIDKMLVDNTAYDVFERELEFILADMR